ncbi:MAG: serine/threonine-protein kinase [Myxococcota bacterium]
MDEDKALLETINDLIDGMGLDETIAPSETLNPLLAGHLPLGKSILSTTASEPTLDARLLNATYSKGPVTIQAQVLPSLSVVEESSEEEGSAMVADYSIHGLLGKGGMGVVHSARQHALQREVAFKRLKANPRDMERHAQALLREAMFTGYLEHPNIVPVHQLGRDPDGLPAMVMKRIEGVSWAKMIHEPDHRAWDQVKGERLTWHLGIVLQVCNALAFAHSRGVLHYDIKPPNVMIGRFGEVYVLDWGIARRMEDPPPEREEICGTPHYMAPEMISQGSKALGPWTDVYLLGATLHEVLVQKPRHSGRSITELFVSIALSRPYTYPPEVPEPLAEICNKACHANSLLRYQDVSELREAIELFLQHRASMTLTEAALDSLGLLQSRVHGDVQGSEGDEAVSSKAVSDEAVSSGAVPSGTVPSGTVPSGTVPHEAVQEDRLQLIYQTFSECQFGFEQALKGWPDNVKAQEGLQEALTIMVQCELAQENLGPARVFASRLKAIPPALAEQLEALQHRLELLAHSREQ